MAQSAEHDDVSGETRQDFYRQVEADLRIVGERLTQVQRCGPLTKEQAVNVEFVILLAEGLRLFIWREALDGDAAPARS